MLNKHLIFFSCLNRNILWIFNSQLHPSKEYLRDMDIVDMWNIHQFPTPLLCNTPKNWIYTVLEAEQTIHAFLIELIVSEIQNFAILDKVLYKGKVIWASKYLQDT